MTDALKESLAQLNDAVREIHRGTETLMQVTDIGEARLAIRELVTAVHELHAFVDVAIAPHAEDPHA